MDIRNSRLIILLAIAITVIVSMFSYWQIGKIHQRMPELTEQTESESRSRPRSLRNTADAALKIEEKLSRRKLRDLLDSSSRNLQQVTAELRREQLKNQQLTTQLFELQNRFDTLRNTSDENATLLVDLATQLSADGSNRESAAQLPDMPLLNDEITQTEDIELMQWQIDTANARVKDLEELIFKEMARSSEASEALVLAGDAAVPQLEVLLDSEDSDLQIWAAEILGRMGMDARNATDSLIHAMSDGNPAVREAAKESLDRIDGPAQLGLP